jgi:hypothetical protein
MYEPWVVPLRGPDEDNLLCNNARELHHEFNGSCTMQRAAHLAVGLATSARCAVGSIKLMRASKVLQSRSGDTLAPRPAMTQSPERLDVI